MVELGSGARWGLGRRRLQVGKWGGGKGQGWEERLGEAGRLKRPRARR